MQKGYLKMQRYIALQKIVELGSFTKAANLLGYTQPAMSQMISSLEKELSIKLLYRSRYGGHLTLEGEKLYPFIQRTVAQYQSMLEMVKEIRGLESGVIKIGTFSSVSAHWLPKLIKKFQIQYPNVQFVLHQGDYTTIPEWVRIGEVDFGFVNPDAVKGIRTRLIKEDKLMAVLPTGHPLCEQEYVTMQDLAKEPFVLLEEGAFSETLTAFHAEQIEPDIKLRVHDDYSILSMIEEGLGVSIIPELILCKSSHQVAVRPIQPVVKRKIGIITQDKNTIPIASKVFIKFLLENVDILP